MRVQSVENLLCPPCKHKMMMLPNLVSSAGLLLDILGAILIWKYGLPDPIRRDGVQLLALEQADPNEAQKANQYDRYSKVGLLLLISGFCVQLISNFL